MQHKSPCLIDRSVSVSVSPLDRQVSNYMAPSSMNSVYPNVQACPPWPSQHPFCPLQLSAISTATWPLWQLVSLPLNSGDPREAPQIQFIYVCHRPVSDPLVASSAVTSGPCQSLLSAHSELSLLWLPSEPVCAPSLPSIFCPA